MGGRDLALPLLDPAQEGASQSAPAPVGVNLTPVLVIAAAIVVLLPARLSVGDRDPIDLGQQQVLLEVQPRRVRSEERRVGKECRL